MSGPSSSAAASSPKAASSPLAKDQVCSATKEELLASNQTYNVLTPCPLCNSRGTKLSIGLHRSGKAPASSAAAPVVCAALACSQAFTSQESMEDHMFAAHATALPPLELEEQVEEDPVTNKPIRFCAVPLLHLAGLTTSAKDSRRWLLATRSLGKLLSLLDFAPCYRTQTGHGTHTFVNAPRASGADACAWLWCLSTAKKHMEMDSVATNALAFQSGAPLSSYPLPQACVKGWLKRKYRVIWVNASPAAAAGASSGTSASAAEPAVVLLQDGQFVQLSPSAELADLNATLVLVNGVRRSAMRQWNQTTPFGMCVLLSPDNITMLVKSAEACILTRNVPNLSLEEFRQSQLLHAVRSKAAPTVEHPQLWFTWQLVRGAFLAAQDTSEEPLVDASGLSLLQYAREHKDATAVERLQAVRSEHKTSTPMDAVVHSGVLFKTYTVQGSAKHAKAALRGPSVRKRKNTEERTSSQGTPSGTLTGITRAGKRLKTATGLFIIACVAGFVALTRLHM